MKTIATNTLLIIAGAVLCSWISSALFFLWIGLPEDSATPISIYQYWFHYWNDPELQGKLAISTGVPFCIIIACCALMLYKPFYLHGNARFQTAGEIQRSGLFAKTGVILGKFKNKIMMDDGGEHILVYAPTGSGKGVSFVIPNLLTWNESAVVLDLKLENYEITSGFRHRHGHEVYVFAPGYVTKDGTARTHRFNPCDLIPRNPGQRINGLQKIAQFLCPTPNQGDPMWSSEARNLFIGVALFLLDTTGKLTLGMVNRFVKGKNPEEMAEAVIENQDKLDRVCIHNLKAFCEMGDKQRSGVQSELVSSLSLMDNPLIDAATSESDFDVREVRKKKMTIYVGVTPDNLDRLAPLLNLFFQSLIDANTNAIKGPEYPYTCLLLMDEFTALKRMDIIKQGIAFFRGYGLRLGVVIQSVQQLYDHYREAAARSMIANFKNRIAFTPNDPLDAKEISEALGTYTAKSVSKSFSKSDPFGSKSVGQTARPLMLPQELQQMSADNAIIMREASLPIMAKKARYFESKEFKGRFFYNNEGPAPSDFPVLDYEAFLASLEEEEQATMSEGGEVEIELGIGESVDLNNKQEFSDDELNSLVDSYFATGS